MNTALTIRHARPESPPDSTIQRFNGSTRRRSKITHLPGARLRQLELDPIIDEMCPSGRTVPAGAVFSLAAEMDREARRHQATADLDKTITLNERAQFAAIAAYEKIWAAKLRQLLA